MIWLKSKITTGLLALTLCLALFTLALVMNDAQTAQAEIAHPSITTEDVVYLQLTDAPPVRDITQQAFAPLP